MERWQAILVFGALYLAPMAHVLFARRAGPFRPPAGSRCPFGPRAGWLVLTALLGPIGWLMFIFRRHRRVSS